ncbi:preprotein translocase subunit SecE [Acholeplasma equirhinis]|uniref:preprotein translocase subunit SecE n=1 Tax=Acholeplasma equirhinis TaxID=555393 RepID=UPI00197AA38F|nr:preprotein translocase subunit SecE [Acholeplasma equirhinis]MBN3490895.1 preprotein translocase subunit SecE [Acholeplasma equirhinis]
MAIKQKEAQPSNKLLEILTTEYKGESLILGVLATITAALAVMIIGRVQGFHIPEDFPVLGGSPNDMIFAWTVLVIAILGLSLVIYPFFLPAFPELRKISWAGWYDFADNAIRVIIFVLIFTVFVSVIDATMIRLIQVLG